MRLNPSSTRLGDSHGTKVFFLFNLEVHPLKKYTYTEMFVSDDFYSWTRWSNLSERIEFLEIQNFNLGCRNGTQVASPLRFMCIPSRDFY